LASKGDDSFYRVSLYLWRYSTSNHYFNPLDELKHASKEYDRKLAESQYEMISTINISSKKYTHVPNVTITPTTIQIKPLKFCQTNRVIREVDQFGPSTNFALVDLREENGRDLQAYDFKGLRTLLMKYLDKNGGFEIGKNRWYKYLHHSQSQLREKQFWFYHEENGFKTLEQAYKWMGNYETIVIPQAKFLLVDDVKTEDSKFNFTDGCGTISPSLCNE
ncbi:unnamed protein product, partial [Didymodactylos carnosus]